MRCIIASAAVSVGNIFALCPALTTVATALFVVGGVQIVLGEVSGRGVTR
ncbi:hypothetical protein [Pseudoclavibacter sp. CFCC 13611]|nr:hypothetical protein [Pseudoclavibacter sp. CFCC 13611]